MKSQPDQSRVQFGNLENQAMFTLPGDKNSYVYRKKGAVLEEALPSGGLPWKFKPSTLLLNPLTEVIPWPSTS